jgi:hypothetical protein
LSEHESLLERLDSIHQTLKVMCEHLEGLRKISRNERIDKRSAA